MRTRPMQPAIRPSVRPSAYIVCYWSMAKIYIGFETRIHTLLFVRVSKFPRVLAMEYRTYLWLCRSPFGPASRHYLLFHAFGFGLH